jgi:hypothetical protein
MGDRTLKWGSSPPRAEMPISKWLFLKDLYSKSLGQIHNLVPHRLMPRLKSKTTPGDTLRTRPYSTPIEVCIQKLRMGVASIQILYRRDPPLLDFGDIASIACFFVNCERFKPLGHFLQPANCVRNKVWRSCHLRPSHLSASYECHKLA